MSFFFKIFFKKCLTYFLNGYKLIIVQRDERKFTGMTKTELKQTHKAIADVFSKKVAINHEVATVITGDEEYVTLAISHATVKTVEFIIEISIKHQWVANVYTIHGHLSKYEMGRYEEAINEYFNRKDAE